jgi:carbonic anhydrase
VPDSRTPAKVWQQMVRGNQRFVSGEPAHPRQDVERRTAVAFAQSPDAALFGCSDSRLAAEIIFDKGIGDLFVVRNAGQVISESVVGSLEYAVGVLNVPLILVLGHDECGAVRAAIDSQIEDAVPLPPYIDQLIQQIVPAVSAVAGPAPIDAASVDTSEVGRRHLRRTVMEVVSRSELISDAVAAGTVAIIGANYKLLEGTAVADIVIGDVTVPE